MELTQEATSVLTPVELRQIRKFWAVWSLERLSQESGVSKTQLSQYENAGNHV
jgi:transcriptional regulator with XRE-family HTH domain